MKNDKALQFDLIGNAKDFFVQAVIDAKQHEARAWKYSLIHLASSLELIIKSILAKEHWSLIFDSLNNAAKDKYESGDFQSVDFSKALGRLTRIVSLNLSDKDRKFLDRVRVLRNKILHYCFAVTEVQIQSLVEQGWALFIRLLEENLPENYDEQWVQEMSQELVHFETFVKERLEYLGDRLRCSTKPSKYFRVCNICSQDAVVVEDDHETTKCLFCGDKKTIIELALTSDGDGGPCPKCENGHLGFILYNNDEGEFHCVLCGFKSEYNYNDECSKCGQVYWNENGDPVCEDCWRSTVESE